MKSIRKSINELLVKSNLSILQEIAGDILRAELEKSVEEITR